MDAETFVNTFCSVSEGLSGLVKALSENPDLIGCLSIEDFALLQDLVKSYSWYRS